MPMSDQQMAAILQMGDLSTEEQKLAMQQAQADQLRKQGMQPSARRDFGSQAARAMQGIGGALADKQNAQAMQDFSQKKNDTMHGVYQALGIKLPEVAGPQMPQKQPIDPTQPLIGGVYGETI